MSYNRYNFAWKVGDIINLRILLMPASNAEIFITAIARRTSGKWRDCSHFIHSYRQELSMTVFNYIILLFTCPTVCPFQKLDPVLRTTCPALSPLSLTLHRPDYLLLKSLLRKIDFYQNLLH